MRKIVILTIASILAALLPACKTVDTYAYFEAKPEAFSWPVHKIYIRFDSDHQQFRSLCHKYFGENLKEHGVEAFDNNALGLDDKAPGPEQQRLLLESGLQVMMMITYTLRGFDQITFTTTLYDLSNLHVVWRAESSTKANISSLSRDQAEDLMDSFSEGLIEKMCEQKIIPEEL